MPMRVFSKLPSGSILLEAECADRRVKTFVEEYRARTGVTLRPKIDFQVQPSKNDNKRGLEARIYFNATAKQVGFLRQLGYRVQGPRTRGYRSPEFSYRIDLNALFWTLVANGFRL